MRGRWGRGLSLAGAAAVLSGIGHASGHSQLVMEETFFMETSTCDGMSCRKEIIGANETLGVGALVTCSQSTTYWRGALDYAPMDHTDLFELWYSCRKESPPGEHVMLMSWEECGMVAQPCLDVGINPDTSEATYQVAFDFKHEGDRAAYDVSVDVRLYMRYLKVDDDFYTLRTKDPPRCDLQEACHRSCEPEEWGFYAELGDSMGDGWNAGGVNLFDHFRLESESELMAIVAADMTAPTSQTDNTAVAVATARRTSYKNTMLGGSSRKVPVCLADGEYLFSTEFQVPSPDPLATYGTYSAPDSVFSIGGRLFSESTWTFCGYTGMLSDYTHVRVSDGVCVATTGWGEAAPPSATPVVGVTLAPTPAPTPAPTIPATITTSDGFFPLSPTPHPTTLDGSATDKDDNTNGDGEDSNPDDNNEEGGEDGDAENEETRETPTGENAGESAGEASSLTTLEIWGIGLGAAAVAGLAAAGGTFAHNNGWFATAAGAAAVGGAAGGGGNAPNPDVDEFAP